MKADIENGVLIIRIPVRFLVHLKQNDNDLTAREMQILPYMQKGLQNKEIAQQLGIALRTVTFHTTSILKKLGKTRAQIIREGS